MKFGTGVNGTAISYVGLYVNEPWRVEEYSRMEARDPI